jgi:hypothetical protein
MMALDHSKAREFQLPNGCTLYVTDNGIGGRNYVSDEIGGGVPVWDTCLVDVSTLIAAINVENTIVIEEFHEKRKDNSRDISKHDVPRDTTRDDLGQGSQD